MNFVLQPQPNEGNGDANNHTSEAKPLDHAMLVRTFITHRTHQELRALQSTEIATGCSTPSRKPERPARPSLNSSPVLRRQPISIDSACPPLATACTPPPQQPILCARQPILCAHQPIQYWTEGSRRAPLRPFYTASYHTSYPHTPTSHNSQ